MANAPQDSSAVPAVSPDLRPDIGHVVTSTTTTVPAAGTTETVVTGSELLTVEQHKTDANTPDWLFNSTKAYFGWPVGKEVSREDFDAALDTAANCKTGESVTPADADSDEATPAVS